MAAPICLWSGPRNVSTALMYSFAQRSDMRVIDEPLYGHYLRVSNADHPGRDDVMQAQNCDGQYVMDELLRLQQVESKTLFVKHMAHHLVDIDLQFLQKTNNILLIRDPRQMLPSLTIQLPRAQATDTGLQQQYELFQSLTEDGRAPVVLDSRELLLDPETVLQQLCQKLAIGFEPTMLQWAAGPRQEDGVWAPHWYHAVHKSTGFAPYQAKHDFPAHLEALLRECEPWYQKLYARALRADAKDLN